MATYVAIRHNHFYRLLGGKISLGTEIDLGKIKPISYRMGLVIAERVVVEPKLTLDEIVEKATEQGTLAVSSQFQFSLIANDDKPASAHYAGDGYDNKFGRQLIRKLYIDGMFKQDLDRSWYDEAATNEALRMSNPPFDNLKDLFETLDLETDLLGRGSSMIVEARSPALLLPESKARSSQLELHFETGRLVHPGPLGLSYIAKTKAGRGASSTVGGSQMKPRPSADEGWRYFERYPLAEAQSVKVFLSYGGASLGEFEFNVEPTQETRPAKEEAKTLDKGNRDKSKRVFVVHGHDVAAREGVARFIQKLGLEPIILHEQPDGGKTIIEKFEHNSDVSYAVVLLTPDDVGSKRGDSTSKPRPRQNVIFELGYFVGVLGRSHVAALVKGEVERPSDYDGVVYISLDDHDAWKMKLARELQTAGHAIDMNNVL
ncbi:MAG TPA: nucleotide-binding protein [Gammaproteobacteria bacterium]|jgi:predicted nucleotide-binding protein